MRNVVNFILVPTVILKRYGNLAARLR